MIADELRSSDLIKTKLNSYLDYGKLEGKSIVFCCKVYTFWFAVNKKYVSDIEN